MNKQMNWIKRGAVVAVMAGLMGFAPVAANAATITEGQATQEIKKEWTVASNAQWNKDQEFTFRLEYKSAVPVGTNATTDPTLVSGANGTVAIETDDSSTTLHTGSIDLAKLVKQFDFSAPGQYRFELTEVNDNNNSNIVWDTTSKYTVRVDVVWADPIAKTVQVDGVYILGSKTIDGLEEKADEAVFKNGPADNSSLTVSKIVAGTAANTNDSFSYTLRVEGATGSYTVNLPGNMTDKLTAGTDYKFSLKHGESITVSNLPVGATYTVTEGDTDYKETYEVDSAKATEGRVASGEVGKDGSAVAYTNEKGFAPQTGITMNALPFVGIAVVAVAGGAALVISRKRRSGEEF